MSKLFLVGLVQNSSPKWLRQDILLTLKPPSSPSLQMTEQIFLGGDILPSVVQPGYPHPTSRNARDSSEIA